MKVTLAAVQFSCDVDVASNVEKAVNGVRRAHARGANVVLLQELFQTQYFCAAQRPEFLAIAEPSGRAREMARFQALARELGIVLPFSYYEQAGNARFNSVEVIDADGSVLGRYRKAHIPQAPGYEEKYYFSPGDSPPKPFRTAYGNLGVGICWDQWFPEVARSLVLQGADYLLYPTAIGDEPLNRQLDSAGHWQRVMQGHAAANIVPVVAANRTGRESVGGVPVRFYGSSFITDHTGSIVAALDRDEEGVAVHVVDIDECRRYRAEWGLFRDRRPDLYGALLTLDGSIREQAA